MSCREDVVMPKRYPEEFERDVVAVITFDDC